MNNQNIIDAVAKRNITNIRSVLKSCMSQDPNFSRNIYQEALEYILSNSIARENLFDQPDNETFKGKQEWDKSYLDSVMGDLLFNFSEERINHIKEVGRYLYPIKPTQPSKVISHPDHRVSNENDQKKFLALVLLGGVILAILIIALVKKNH